MMCLGVCFFFLINLFIYLFIFGCVGSSFLCEGFLQLRWAGATPHRSAQAPHRRGLSRCRAQAPDAQAQQLWLTGPVAPRHAGSSQTRARTRVPWIGRQTLNHRATREALGVFFFVFTLLGVCWASWICKSMFFIRFGKFLVVISSNCFSVSILLSSSGTLIICMLNDLLLSCRSLRFCLNFSSIFSLCSLDWLISLTFSAAVSILITS